MPSLAPCFYPLNAKSAGPLLSKRCVSNRARSSKRDVSSSATSLSAKVSEMEIERKKHELLMKIQETQRGLTATTMQRSTIDEAMVGLECCDSSSSPLDLVKLDGTWRMQYTSASDVLVLLEAAARVPFFKVGQIFQKFECKDENNKALIRNVIQWSIPSLLENEEGATLVVSASFKVLSSRNIYLNFEQLGVQNFQISEEFQALITPAFLPRSFFNLQILQFIRTFKAQFPLQSPRRQSVSGLYYLSFLDDNMLLGRQIGSGGAFVFTKAQPLCL